jgi:hypothetical protein
MRVSDFASRIKSADDPGIRDEDWTGGLCRPMHSEIEALSLMHGRHREYAGGSHVWGCRNRARPFKSSVATLAALDEAFRRAGYSSRLI